MIKNIILDLGGVIVDIDIAQSESAFKKLGGFPDQPNHNKKETKWYQLIEEYSRGNMTSPEFREQYQLTLDIDVDIKQFDQAWNAMILNFRNRIVNLLKQLKSKYNLYILSDNDEIHLNRLKDMLQKEHNIVTPSPTILFGPEYFDMEYYSHLHGGLKEDKKIFERVIAENKLQKMETLFVDDLLGNIQVAETLGIQTFHLKEANQNLLEDLFARLI